MFGPLPGPMFGPQSGPMFGPQSSRTFETHKPKKRMAVAATAFVKPDSSAVTSVQFLLQETKTKLYKGVQCRTARLLLFPLVQSLPKRRGQRGAGS